MTDKNVTILLVDDDEDYRFQMRVQFEAAGYGVVEAASHAEAQKVLVRERFDLAVVDLMMEEMDAGFALCRELKSIHPNVPVIMVTAVASETGIGFEAGTGEERSWIKADALLAKPVRFEQLLREVDRLLKG